MEQKPKHSFKRRATDVLLALPIGLMLTLIGYQSTLGPMSILTESRTNSKERTHESIPLEYNFTQPYSSDNTVQRVSSSTGALENSVLNLTPIKPTTNSIHQASQTLYLPTGD